MSRTLTPADLALHERLGIPEDLLQATGVRRVTNAEAKALLGVRHRGDLTGILYPRVQPGASSHAVGYRVRRDHPEMEEGRALALTAAALRKARPVLSIALGGCWSWRGRIGKTTDATGARVNEHGPLPDLDRIEWLTRDAVLLFDANVATNPSVRAARRGLADELTIRGARVRIGDLPVEDGINGPDDYVGKYGDVALFTLIDSARSMQPATASDVLLLAGLDHIHGVTLADLEERLRLLKDGLRGADPIRRRIVRELLVSTLKAEKVSGAAALADAAIGGPETEGDIEPASFVLSDDEPAASPVNSAVLFDETAARLRRHIVMSEPQIAAMTLWIAAVYAIDALQRMPMLLISSPTPECGKSTAAALVSGLVPRPVVVASLTTGVLYRLIDKYHPTLIADEAGAWLTDEKSELRGVFNAAHWRSGSFIPRCVGDDHDVKLFNVFGPKLIAMIGRPSPTILSRSIMITLQKKTDSDRVQPLRDEVIRQELEPLRQQWRRWALDHLDRLRCHEPDMPTALPVNRASDNWRPMLSIAEVAGGEWPAHARAAALTLSGVRVTEDEPINVTLLTDIQVVFREHQQPAYLSSEEIIATLKALPERPWADWNKGCGISAAQLAKHVRDFDPSPLGLHTRKTRLPSGKTANRWHRADFLNPWARYVTADPEHTEQLNESSPKPVISNPEQPHLVPGAENAFPPIVPAFVPGVPASGTGSGRRRWLVLSW